MNNEFSLIVVFILGVGVGSAYFANLWWTIHHLPYAQQHLRWFLVSWLIRTLGFLGGAAASIYPVRDPSQKGLFLSVYLVGLLLARSICLLSLPVEPDHHHDMTSEC